MTKDKATAFLKAGMVSLALLGLNACEIKQQRGDAVEEDVPETIDEAPIASEPPASILRPEVDQPKTPSPVALKPLETVVSFARGGSDLDDAATSVLDTVLATPQASANGAITLRGHSDTGAAASANLAESQARAEAVRAYLVEQGVAEERFTIIAFGEQNPVEPNALPDGTPNESGRAANRRVEIRIEAPKPKPAPTEAGAKAEEGST